MRRKTMVRIGVPVAAVAVTALVLILVFSPRRKASKPAGPSREPALAAESQYDTATSSTRPAEERVKNESAAKTASRPPSEGLARDYSRKVDDLHVKVFRTRQRLIDAKQLTPEATTLLSQIEGKILEALGALPAVAGAATSESQKAAAAAIDAKLAEARKMMGNLPH